MNFKQLQKNIEYILKETNQVNITFINTFNILSLPKFDKFLQYILKLREKYSREKQGIKKIPIIDPWYKHPDFILNPRQRIGFDIPLLRYPLWQCIQILPPKYHKYLEKSIKFMKENRSDEVKQDFRGFRDFEIDKAERNLQWMKEGANMKPSEKEIALKNLKLFFKQHDERRKTNFTQTFPELKELLED